MLARESRNLQLTQSKRNIKARKVSFLLFLLTVLALFLKGVDSKGKRRSKKNHAEHSSGSEDRSKSEEPQEDRSAHTEKKENPPKEDSIGTKNKNAHSSNVLEGNTGYISIIGTDKQQITLD